MLSIGLLDDHEIFRVSLKKFLEETRFYKVIIDAAEGGGFCNSLERLIEKPEIVLSDLQMPGKSGMDTLIELKSKYPGIKVIIVTQYFHQHIINQLFQKGADGFIIKSSSIESFCSAIQIVKLGMKVIVSTDNKIHTFQSIEESSFRNFSQLLSKKQLDFIKLCAVPEYTYKEIANKLQISPKTADRYRDDLFKKLRINSRTGLAIYALQTGIIDLNTLSQQ